MLWKFFLISSAIFSDSMFVFSVTATDEDSIEFQTVPPTASAECFDVYLPQLQTAADQWSINYNNCISTAQDERNTFFTQISNDQANMIASSNSICDYIKGCQTLTVEVDFLECFSNLSENALDTIYTISNEASDDLLSLTEQPNNINDEMYRCTNDTQRAYVEKTAEIYEELDNCLLYGVAETTTETVADESEFELMEITEQPTRDNAETETSGASEAETDGNTNLSTTEEESTESDYSTLAIMAV